MTPIRGKTVLITGASSGIGAAAARRLATDGAHLVLWARREDRLAELVEELASVEVHTALVDVRDRSQIDDAVARLPRSPDVLINNAGVGMGFAKFHEGDPDDWDINIDTNFKGLAYVSRAVIPLMVEAGRGHIVNIGSTASTVVAPKGHIYAATKHAVRALTEGMSIDLSGTDVRVSQIDPGYADTEFGVVRFLGDVARAKQTYEGFRPMTAEDVADTIAYVVNMPEHLNIANLVIVPAAQRNMYVIDRD